MHFFATCAPLTSAIFLPPVSHQRSERPFRFQGPGLFFRELLIAKHLPHWPCRAHYCYRDKFLA
ncbi:MAG: hypothetical protein EBT62_09785 [Opitutaceae bacterium]|nr:hypothetical protein [Opitutaceae bacterium]